MIVQDDVTTQLDVGIYGIRIQILKDLVHLLGLVVATADEPRVAGARPII